MVGPIGKTSPTPGTPAPAEATTTLSTENIIRKASRSQIEVPMSHYVGAYVSHQEILCGIKQQRIAAGCPSLGMRAVTPLGATGASSAQRRPFTLIEAAPIHAKKRTLIIGSKTLIDTHHRSSAPIGAHPRQESTLRRPESTLRRPEGGYPHPESAHHRLKDAHLPSLRPTLRRPEGAYSRQKRTLIIGSKTLIDTHHRSSAPIGAHLRQESTLRRDESALFLAPTHGLTSAGRAGPPMTDQYCTPGAWQQTAPSAHSG
eukprot:scaffold56190_cov61-Phaeocystis_antarctica.AAC.1